MNQSSIGGGSRVVNLGRAAIAGLGLLLAGTAPAQAQGAPAASTAMAPRLVVQSGPLAPIGLELAISPDNLLIATAGGERGAAYIWQVETGRLLCTLQAGMDRGAAFLAGGMAPVAFSADSHLLATANEQAVSVWDLRQCRLRTTLSLLVADDERPITGLLTLADGRLLASTEGGTLYTGDAFRVGSAFAPLPKAPHAAELLHGRSRDGRWLLVSGEAAGSSSPIPSRSLGVVDAQTGAVDPLVSYRGVRASAGVMAAMMPRAAAISPSGRWVIEAQQGAATLYDRQSRSVTARVEIYPKTAAAPAAAKPRVRAPALNPFANMSPEMKEAMKALSGSGSDGASEIMQELQRMQQMFDEAAQAAAAPDDAKPDWLLNSVPGWVGFSEKEDLVYVLESRDQWRKPATPDTPAQEPRMQVRRLPSLDLVKSVPISDPFANNRLAAGLGTNFAASPDGSSLALSLLSGDFSGGRTGLLDLTQLPAQAVVRAWKPTGNGPGRIAWTPDGQLVALHGGAIGSAATASLAGRSGPPADVLRAAPVAPATPSLSNVPSVQTLLVHWSLDSGEVATRGSASSLILPTALSAQGRFIATLSADVPGIKAARPGYRLEVVDTQTRLPVFASVLQGVEVTVVPLMQGIALSPDGRKLALLSELPVENDASGSRRQRLSLHDTATGRLLAQQTLPLRAGATSYQQARMRFTDDGRTILVVGDAGGEWLRIGLSDRGAMQVDAVKTVSHLLDVVGDGPYRLLVRGTATAPVAGMEVIALPEGAVGLATSNPAGTQLAVAHDDNSLQLYDIAPGGRIGDAARLQGHAAAVVSLAFSPDGRRLASSDVQGSTFVWDVASGTLLARLFAFTDGSWAVVDTLGRFDTNNLEDLEYLHWVIPDDPLRALPLDIFMREYFSPGLLARLMRGETLPAVRPVAALNRAQPGVRIVSVAPARSDPRRVDVTVEVEGQSDRAGRPGGAADLRLFRDGKLVGSPERAGTPLPLDAKTNRASVTYRNIRLPLGAEKTNFSAYAFNLDQVKSPTARLEYRPPPAGPAAAKVQEKGKAYVIAIGVNRYDNPAFNLSFAANDARLAAEVLSGRLVAGRGYREVVTVPLVSEGDRQRDATKARIRAVLAVLAGKPADRGELAGLSQAARLEAATPEDLLIITFAGHGHAGEAGLFYLLPQDIGSGTAMRMTPQVLGQSISSDELEDWLRDVDAGEIAMVIDACHSAASVEGDGFKAGPMGSKGLGQLAYDKGMRILAASQANDVALEAGKLLHGLLTFALMRDGIEARRADFKPADKRIALAEWLAFGVDGVPQLQRELAAGKRAADGQVRSASRPGGGVLQVQQPRLFDFSRQGDGPVLEVLR